MILPNNDRRSFAIPPLNPNQLSMQFPSLMPPMGLRDESWVRNGDLIPELYFQMQPGFFLGSKWNQAVIKPWWLEGHIAGFGGSGLGKTTTSINGTLVFWQHGMVVVDLNGAAIDFYEKLKYKGFHKQPFKILNLMSERDTIFRYDPFYMVRQVKEEEKPRLIRELALAIVPSDSREMRFWFQSAQNILTAGLIYYFSIGVKFMDALEKIQSDSLAVLVKKVNNNTMAKLYMSQFADIKDIVGNKMAVSAYAELSTHLIPFVTDPQIKELFTPNENIVKWDDIEAYSVFITVNEYETEQKSSAVRLLLLQLFRHLQRRPEKHSTQGKLLTPLLILIDEFPEFGKLNSIERIFSNLRKRNVTISIFCQMISQLDDLYGVNCRQTILGNCNHQIFLGCHDSINLKYFSEKIGTIIVQRMSCGISHASDWSVPTTSTMQFNETRELVYQPEELEYLGNELILFMPNGTKNNFCKLEKYLFSLN